MSLIDRARVRRVYLPRRDLITDTVLGACNPKLVYEVLQLEDNVGTMLPATCLRIF
ncbi:DUF302 domain-containing protein [Qipengyuania flava]|uniref:DUF302 domain-containing protein n=1 Tax=Qipengyuania flava TaxID=192812 RepID=UPI003C79A249